MAIYLTIKWLFGKNNFLKMDSEQGVGIHKPSFDCGRPKSKIKKKALQEIYGQELVSSKPNRLPRGDSIKFPSVVGWIMGSHRTDQRNIWCSLLSPRSRQSIGGVTRGLVMSQSLLSD
jgi:hypothetical protein